MYKSENFDLIEIENARSVTMGMQIKKPIVNTRDLPHTYIFLKNKIPSVLRTACFNEENLPFDKEVRRTELGHLFEHILLDVMCRKKVGDGFDDAVFYGHTDWNWKEDPYGFFKIFISVRNEDLKIFNKSLKDTILIFDQFLHQKKSMGGL